MPLEILMPTSLSMPPTLTLGQVYDHDAGGSHDLLGRAEASLAQLQAAAAQGQPLPLVNPRKQGSPGYSSSGECWLAGLGMTGNVDRKLPTR